MASALLRELRANARAAETAGGHRPGSRLRVRLATSACRRRAVSVWAWRSRMASGSSRSSTNGTQTSATSTCSQGSRAKPAMWSAWWWVATTTSSLGSPAGPSAARSATIASTDLVSGRAAPWLCTPQSTSMRHCLRPWRTVTRKASPKPMLYMRTATVVLAIAPPPGAGGVQVGEGQPLGGRLQGPGVEGVAVVEPAQPAADGLQPPLALVGEAPARVRAAVRGAAARQRLGHQVLHGPVHAGDHGGAGPQHHPVPLGQAGVLEVAAPLGELEDQLRPGLAVGRLPVGDVHAVQLDGTVGVEAERLGVGPGPLVERGRGRPHARGRGRLVLLLGIGAAVAGPAGEVE